MLTNYPPDKLRELRNRAHLSQRDVCKLLGMGIRTLSLAENGKRRPQTSTLERLLNLYAININRIERRERVWDNRPLREDGLAQIARPEREVNRPIQTPPHTPGVVSSHAQQSIKDARQTWTTNKQEVKQNQKGNVI